MPKLANLARARLNQNERSLKDAIENKRVRWHEYRVPSLIPTAISYDAFAQVLAAMDAMRSGIAMRLFQASQQASTMSS